MIFSKNKVKYISFLLFFVLIFGIFNMEVYSDDEYSFERKDKPKPEIKDTIGELKNVTGWVLTPSGEWVSGENIIHNGKIGKSSIQYDKVGINNFEKFILKEIMINDKEYYLLNIISTNGAFKYPNIYEGWYTYNMFYFFVFDKEQWGEFENINKKVSPKLVELKAEYHNSKRIDYISDTNTFIKENINEQIKKRAEEEQTMRYYFVFNLLPFYEKGLIRFNIASAYTYKNGDPSYEVFGDKDNIPTDEYLYAAKEVVKPDSFHNYYFETSIDNFHKLFPIPNK